MKKFYLLFVLQFIISFAVSFVYFLITLSVVAGCCGSTPYLFIAISAFVFVLIKNFMIYKIHSPSPWPKNALIFLLAGDLIIGLLLYITVGFSVSLLAPQIFGCACSM